MIRTVISDMGKVIVFFNNDIFFRKMEKHSSLSFEEMTSSVEEHMDIIRNFDTGQLTPDEFYRQAVKWLRARISRERFFEIYNDIFDLNHPVLEILKRLKSACRLVLLSNTDEMRFGFIRTKFPEVLIFDDYVVSYEHGVMKPDPQIYRVALEKAHAEPGDCLFIDDREENIRAADALGIQTVHFTPETDLEKELQEHGLVL